MRSVHNATFGCVILGVIFAMFAYITATEDQLVTWSGDHEWRFERDSDPITFWLPALVAAFLAVASWVTAWYLHFVRRLSGAPGGDFVGPLRPVKFILICFVVLVLCASIVARWLA